MNFSYNEKLAKDNFIKEFQKAADDGLMNDIGQKLLKRAKEDKKYTKKFAEDFVEFAKNNEHIVKDSISKSFSLFERAHKNKFHLINRICFCAALLLTPLNCALENLLHPKVMNLIYSKQYPQKKNKLLGFYPTINEFITKIKGASLNASSKNRI